MKLNRHRRSTARAFGRILLIALSAGAVWGAGSFLFPDRAHSPGGSPGDAPLQDELHAGTLPVAAYFPIHERMVWKYAGFGNEFAAYIAEVTHQAGTKAQILVTSGAHVVSVYEVSPEQVSRVLRRAEVELVEDFLNAPAEEAYVVIQGPLKVGHSWFSQGGEATDGEAAGGEAAGGEATGGRATDGVPGDSRERRRIESIGGTVTTPAGTFRDVLTVYVERPGLTDSREHYAPGVGLVRSEFLADEPVISELAAVRIGRESSELYLSPEEALDDFGG